MAVDCILKAGDKVALIAPASGQKKGQEKFVDSALSLLTSWSLEVVFVPSVSTAIETPSVIKDCIGDTVKKAPKSISTLGYLSSNDELRAADLIQALTAPDIKAIFVTRGGYGCAKLLPSLEEIVVPTPRLFIGFSDITTLHVALQQTENVISIHAPNLATEQMLAGDHVCQVNHAMLYQFLFGHRLNGLNDETCDANPKIKWLAGQKDNIDTSIDCWDELDGVTTSGGCLSLLTTSLGTSHEIDTRNKVLLIEEVGESPYKIDRMLTHLANAGKFDEVSAIIFGDMVNCDTQSISWRDVVFERFQGTSFPVYETKAFGHGQMNFPWRYKK